MMHILTVATHGPACHEITADLADWLRATGAAQGVLTLIVQHTSASLLIQENADPEVQTDLLAWLDRLAPPADAPSMGWITHRYEGPDDMPAHIRTMLTASGLAVPVQGGRLALGTWQGIYLIEHRDRGHRREIALHAVGA